MNPCIKCVSRISVIIATLLAGTGIMLAADDAGTPVSSSAPAATTAVQTQNDEIVRLKAALAEQQKQIQALQQAIASEQALLEKASGTPAEAKTAFPVTGEVASTRPILPPVAPLPVASPMPIAKPQAPAGGGGNPCEAAPDQNAVPPYLRIGSVCVVPVGFMDMTAFWRDKAAATGTLGSNFGSVPYNNGPTGNLSEFHFSLQNSRLGFRIDGDWKGTHFIGYNEFDFNGTSGSTSMAVTNGAIVPRLRLFWIDARKGSIEFLGGQSWSMMTPSRKGIAALPGDLFYSQVIDINYIAGLTWTRQPGMRVLFHGPGDKITFGFAAEQGDPYIGGSGGGGAIVLPTALAGLAGVQLDQAQNISLPGGYLNQPTFTPDFMAKLAFDPSARFHVEVGGVLSNFHTASLAAPWAHHSTHGEGLTFGINAGLTKNLRWVASGLYSDGEGRYLFGAAPDLIVRADGSLSAVRADSYITGFEDTIKNTLVYGYFSGDYIGKNVAIDTNGSLIGYGYKGSSNSQNRSINEITVGFNQTLWRNPRYGAINMMGQYEWLERAPWYYAAGVAGGKGTHDNTIYFNLRYTLPGSMPNF